MMQKKERKQSIQTTKGWSDPDDDHRLDRDWDILKSNHSSQGGRTFWSNPMQSMFSIPYITSGQTFFFLINYRRSISFFLLFKVIFVLTLNKNEHKFLDAIFI